MGNIVVLRQRLERTSIIIIFVWDQFDCKPNSLTLAKIYEILLSNDIHMHIIPLGDHILGIYLNYLPFDRNEICEFMNTINCNLLARFSISNKFVFPMRVPKFYCCRVSECNYDQNELYVSRNKKDCLSYNIS